MVIARRSMSYVMLLGSVLCLGAFTPFTQVSNVCPKCATGPRFDEVALLGGQKVRANVVAQNSDYYVLERFGELRMVKKSDIGAVEWRDKGPRKLASGDQIMLKSGVVFHGTVIEEQKGRYFVLQAGKRKHVIWNSQVEKVFRGGNAYALPAAPAPPKPAK